MLTASIFILFLFLWLTRWWYKNISLPPGPSRVPILGCIPFTGFKINSSLLSDEKHWKYGDISCFDFGLIKYYVLNDFELSRELFNLEIFSGRMGILDEMRSYRSPNKVVRGIVSNVGSSWQGQRRFAIKNLRDFGYGKRESVEFIQEEAKFLTDELLREGDKTGIILLDDQLNISVLNILWQLTTSKRLDRNDKKTLKALDNVNNYFKTGMLGLTFLFPFLTKILPVPWYGSLAVEIMDFMREEVIEHQKSYDPTAPPRDFIDVYLRKIELQDDEEFNIEQLVNVLTDLFSAGSETTSTLLKWCFLFMSLYQEAQMKCQEEIDQVLGSKVPDKDDADKLVYVSATLQEIFRLANVTAVSLSHVTIKDYNVRGYNIPKGSFLAANLKKFALDPKVFPEPHTFKPERFIKDGKLKTYPQLSPFSVGKRICMGETLARMSSFMFFTYFLQNLNITTVADKPKPDRNEITMGITTIPKPFYIQVTRR